MKLLKVLALTVFCVNTFFAQSTLAAAAYPSKPITMIVPFGAGSGADRILRVALPYIKEALKADIVLDYKDGGGGVVGSNYFMTTKNDGYTLLYYNQPHITIQQNYQKTAYKNELLTPVLGLTWRPDIITVKKDSPFKTIEDLLAYAKENPKKLTIGNTGSFSSNHLTFSMLTKLAEVEMTRIPFDSGAKMNAAILGDQIDTCVSNMQWLTIYPDQLRVLASTAEERPMPDIPTFKEMGYEELVNISAVNVIYIRNNAPKEVIDYLATNLAPLKNNEQLKADYIKEGIDYGVFDGQEMLDLTKTFENQVKFVEAEMKQQ